jgi:hypothetical protein
MSFAEWKNLRSGDVVIVPKSEIGMVEHYLVYGGINIYGHHIYYENIRVYGVRVITEAQFARENPKFLRIRPFNGNEYQRQYAINRAKSLLGVAYNLTGFNCEGYANYVQYGRAYSNQVDNVATAAVAASVLFFLFAAFSGGGRR